MAMINSSEACWRKRWDNGAAEPVMGFFLGWRRGQNGPSSFARCRVQLNEGPQILGESGGKTCQGMWCHSQLCLAERVTDVAALTPCVLGIAHASTRRCLPCTPREQQPGMQMMPDGSGESITLASTACPRHCSACSRGNVMCHRGVNSS